MSRDEVIRKVRKLLNMTTEKGCTEAEAAQAAGLAQKLMMKHRLEASQLAAGSQEAEEELRSWEDPLDTMPKSQRQAWRGRLAMVLSRANGCSVFWQNSGPKPTLNIVGQASDVQTTRYLYQFCLTEIIRLQGNYRGNGATWLTNWRFGVIAGISGSLREARAAARSEFAAETGTSLIVVDQSLAVIDQRHNAAATFARVRHNLRSGGPTGNGTRYNGDARETGKRDGSRINVTGGGKAIGGGQRRLS